MPSPRRALFLPLALASLLAAGVGVTACGEDEKADDDKTTTTEAASRDGEESTTEGSDTTGSTETTEATTPASDEDFAAALEPVMASLEAATDPCAIIEATMAVPQELQDPATPEQSKAAVELMLLIVEKAADTTDDADQAATLRSGHAALADYAESVDYDVAKLDFSGDGPDIPEWQSLDSEMNAFFEANSADCLDLTTPEDTTASSTP